MRGLPALVIAITLALPFIADAQGIPLSNIWQAFVSGGSIGGGGYVMNNSIGEPLAGSVSGGTYSGRFGIGWSTGQTAPATTAMNLFLPALSTQAMSNQ